MVTLWDFCTVQEIVIIMITVEPLNADTFGTSE